MSGGCGGGGGGGVGGVAHACNRITSVEHHKYPPGQHEMMTAGKRIPVSEEVRTSLSEMKKPGQTVDELLSVIIGHEKERRFLAEMATIEAEGTFVEFAP